MQAAEYSGEMTCDSRTSHEHRDTRRRRRKVDGEEGRIFQRTEHMVVVEVAPVEDVREEELGSKSLSCSGCDIASFRLPV